MNDAWRPACPAWTWRSVLLLGLLASGAPGQAQTRIELPTAAPGIGAAVDSLRSDLGKLNSYNQSVEEKLRPEKKVSRDPFQTTPELRSRSGRAGFSPASVGGGDLGEEPLWRVQALVLGRSPQAVLVRNTAGKARGAQEAQRQHFVQPGDLFEMPDGRSFQVLRIDRQGVWMRSDGVEEEEMRIQ